MAAVNGAGREHPALRPRSRGQQLWATVASRSITGVADVALLLLDAVLVLTAYTLMLAVRYELAVPTGVWEGFVRFIPVAVVVHLGANRLGGLYGPVWKHASILEAKRILLTGGSATVVLTTFVVAWERFVPLSVAMTGGLVAMGLFGVLRFQSRLFAFRRRERTEGPQVLVVGAGSSGSGLLRELSRSRTPSMQVVALVDDDLRKVGRWIADVPIAGTLDDIVEVGQRYSVDQVLLAIPTADSALVRRVADAAAQLEVQLRVVPSVTELMHSAPQLRDVRDLSIDDLLGRQPVSTDLDGVRRMVKGKRVLVTGGGGSIGSEIVRQVVEYEPSALIVLDRDETHLFDAMAAIQGRGTPVLLDIRDLGRLRRSFREHRPEIVFHAAANKHVPLLEDHPSEAAATNVLGTANLVTAAREAGVGHFVLISTDKAVRPRSVMGASKRLAEQVVLSGTPEDATWCAVRFGNVLGSRGSVVPTFMRQISEGGPVTLTHPDMTRFFMSIPEAVQLVLQAAALADDHEVFMLDMGEPVRIIDLARRMISLAGHRVGVDIDIEVTGLRPGEKLSEELHTEEEHPEPTDHSKVIRLHPPVGENGSVAALVRQLETRVDVRDDDAVRALLLATSAVDGDDTAELSGDGDVSRAGSRR